MKEDGKLWFGVGTFFFENVNRQYCDTLKNDENGDEIIITKQFLQSETPFETITPIQATEYLFKRISNSSRIGGNLQHLCKRRLLSTPVKCDSQTFYFRVTSSCRNAQEACMASFYNSPCFKIILKRQTLAVSSLRSETWRWTDELGNPISFLHSCHPFSFSVCGTLYTLLFLSISPTPTASPYFC